MVMIVYFSFFRDLPRRIKDIFVTIRGKSPAKVVRQKVKKLTEQFGKRVGGTLNAN